MLDLFGRDYVIEHAVSEINRRAKEDVYRQYVTETLRACAKGLGTEFTVGYKDLLDSMRPQAPEDNRSADDIISTIKKKAEALA